MSYGGFDLLASGKLFDAMLYPYTSIMGSELFFAFLMMIACSLTYIKLRNVTVIGIGLMLTSAVLIPKVPPNLQIYFVAMLILGVSITIYKLFRSR